MRRTLILSALLLGWPTTPLHAADNDSASESPRPGDEFTDIDQLVFDARRAFQQRQFDAAITTCEKILQKDPGHLIALKIMGSGYFMLEDYDRARHVWERALELAPEDPDIPKYMARLPQ
uniref:Tetratricopeptide repeat domain protein n=1 Tax=uncultured bacterium CSLF42 TaxID=1091574 RepID=G4WVY8_9BACT|nr:tetratricopeptide repeat domain protein [uncultured bacterium CSLF42]